ncbi:MAG TPA: STAS domain-containing protein [Acidimicrobiia bacterium]|jgi:anti-sigma B factor antagonist
MTPGAGVPEPDLEDALAPISIDVRPGTAHGEWVVAVAGEIDVATSPELRQAIDRVLGSADRVTIDLAATTFIDSSGLGVLVAALKQAKERGHDAMTLRGVQEPVRRVLEITGLTGLFAVED